LKVSILSLIGQRFPVVALANPLFLGVNQLLPNKLV
jgi:hypothetical protein